jgi:hypothetical protein
VRFRCLVSFIFTAGYATLLAGCSGGSQSASAPGAMPQSVAGSSVANRLAIHAIDNSVALPRTRLKAQGGTQPTAFVDVAHIEKAGRDLIAFSDSAANAVYIMGSGGFYAILTTGLSEPQGLAFDTAGTLYVANTSDSQVLAFPKPYTGTPVKLRDSGQYPVGVAVASDGTVGVTNMFPTRGGAGSVSIYAKGATSPCATVRNGSFARAYFDAFDKAGKLYVDGTNAGGRFVVGKVTGECRAKSIAPLSVANEIGSPGGVAVLTDGDIALGDQAGLNVTSIVYTYKPPSGGFLGPPTKTTTLKAVYDGVDFAFKQFDHSLWIVDAGAGDFAEYTYPAGAGITAFPNFEQPAGVAAYPPQP